MPASGIRSRARVGQRRDVRGRPAVGARGSAALMRRLRAVRAADRHRRRRRRARDRRRDRPERARQARGRCFPLEMSAASKHQRPTVRPRFESPEAAAGALGLAARRAAWLRRPEGVVPELANIQRAAARTIAAEALAGVDEVWLDADRSRRRPQGAPASGSRPRRSP